MYIRREWEFSFKLAKHKMGQGFTVDRYNSKVFMEIHQYINLNPFHISFFVKHLILWTNSTTKFLKKGHSTKNDETTECKLWPMTWPWSMTLSLLCAPVDGLTHIGGVFGGVESVVHVQHVPKYAGGDLPHRALRYLTEHVVPHLTEERWWNPRQPIYNSHIINYSQLHLYAENYFFPFFKKSNCVLTATDRV